MLGGNLEENVLAALAWSDNLAPHIALSVKPSDFSIQVYRTIASAALDYLRSHHRPPKIHIVDLLEHDIRRSPEAKFMQDVLRQMQQLAPHLDEDYVRDSLDRFVETQRLINAVNLAADLLGEGDLERAREILYANNVLPKDHAGVWLRDTEQWLRFLRPSDATELFSSGIEVFDDRGVRPARGDLMVLLGGSGVGKSWFLINTGKHNIFDHRKNVLHITLENSLDLTLQRYTQCFLALTSNEAKHLDLGMFRDVDDASLSTRRWRRPDDDRIRWEPHIGAKLFEAVKKLDKPELLRRLLPFQSRGQLLVKHFPTGTLTLGMLHAYLDALERSEGFKPDLLLLDYMTLMALDVRDLRIAIGQLARSLRGLAALRDCAVVTVVQANRKAAGKRRVYSTNIAEDYSIFGTSDTFLTYSQTQHERRLGIARILVDKARNSQDKWLAVITQAYEIGQFCLDSAYMTAPLEEQINEKAPQDNASNDSDDDE